MSDHSTRLFVLGILSRHEELHGHAIRQMAHEDHTELWTDVKVGSLYQALRQLAAEGLVEPVRTEHCGLLPLRTIYRITEAGRRELWALRGAALDDTRLRPDPADLAVALSEELSAAELTHAVERRLERVRGLAAERAELGAQVDSLLSVAERMVFAHYRLRYQAEIAWNEELLKAVPEMAADARRQKPPLSLAGRGGHPHAVSPEEVM